MKEVKFGEKFFCYCMACKENKGNGSHGELLKLSMPVIHDFRYHMWIPELKDQLNSGQCLLKIGPDHVQKSGGRLSENYY